MGQKKLITYCAGAIALVGFMLLGFVALGNKAQPPTNIAGTPVIVNRATTVAQGVAIEWIAAQDTEVTGYVVEKQQQGTYTEAGRTEDRQATSFLDSDGQTGDRYRVIATHPAHHSKHEPSATVVAQAARPGENFTIVPRVTKTVLGESTLPTPTIPAEQANRWHLFAVQALDKLDASINANRTEVTRNTLSEAQEYYRQVLLLLPQLSATQKRMLAQSCEQQMSRLETNLHVLPEDAQMDGMLVLAECHAIEDAAI